MEQSGIGIPSILPVLWSDLWDSQIFADLAGQLVFDFRMPGYRRSKVASRIAPPRMTATLSDQAAPMAAKVLEKRVALHTVTSSSV